MPWWILLPPALLALAAGVWVIILRGQVSSLRSERSALTDGVEILKSALTVERKISRNRLDRVNRLEAAELARHLAERASNAEAAAIDPAAELRRLTKADDGDGTH